MIGDPVIFEVDNPSLLFPFPFFFSFHISSKERLRKEEEGMVKEQVGKQWNERKVTEEKEREGKREQNKKRKGKQKKKESVA